MRNKKGKKKGEKYYVFEISWEVCNKVGGINTVVKTKVPYMIKEYRDRYYLIGPYFPDRAISEFRERVPPDKLSEVFEKLKNLGIICHYGKWLIRGEPNVILVDYGGYIYKNYEIKTKLWEKFGIDSLGTEFHDFDEPILWGDAVGVLLHNISDLFGNRVVAHFHEWLSCGALLYIKRNNLKIATVFTTHATTLGRTMAGNNVDIYSIMEKIDPEEEAYKWGVHSKHQVERVSAHVADVFTTVSEITAIEARNFLKKNPDMLLFNGIDTEKLPTFEEVLIRHRLYREKIKEFLQYYFFPYYSFDLDDILIYFISGRYEFHNKGIDIFISALSKLNRVLKNEKSRRTIITFFWIPSDVIRIKPELLMAKAYYEDIKDAIEDNINEIESRIIRALISRKSITENVLFKEDFLKEAKKKVMRFLRDGNPPLCTHDIQNEENDPILRSFRENNLLNRKEDRVKVILYPIYLTGADNLLDLSYDEAVIGSHLGVFPSYYEPWGYTPLETGALGVAAVTTDFSGFGRYLSQDTIRQNEGIYVIKMFRRSDEEKIENLFEILYQFSKLDRGKRIENKMEARRLALLADWNILVSAYINSHKVAIKRVYDSSG
ncbi:MAG: hypothetical protein DRO94_02810 [Candidatus Altiarchaeales archaeon]|nr:MAG: hypothetical protein DRO95_00325 [Candidatus Altiarchaeales archaeon]RLI94491.1 MAG: hypothetical protein DRO94_02810 [Candidatus Altiarchaeales archaeon]